MRFPRRCRMISYAEVVKWQTRTFEGRVAQAVRVQVPPSAPNSAYSYSEPQGDRLAYYGARTLPPRPLRASHPYLL
jgi:hypothetical protein